MLYSYLDDLEKPLPEEVLHFSASLKQCNLNHKSSLENEIFRIKDENDFKTAFSIISAVVLEMYLCLVSSSFSRKRYFFEAHKSQD